MSVKSNNPVIQMQSGFDNGVILKINPSQNPQKTWICCAGRGEWGTSGAAWWLSKYWKRISKQAGNRPFAFITQTQIGSDDSTTLLHFFFSEEDVEKVAKP